LNSCPTRCARERLASVLVAHDEAGGVDGARVGETDAGGWVDGGRDGEADGLALTTAISDADGSAEARVASGVGEGLRTGELMHAATELAISNRVRERVVRLSTRIGRSSASHV